MRQAQPTLRPHLRRDPGSREHDPAKLSAQLRELALRAHELVRAKDGSAFEAGKGTDVLELELTQVHAQIVQLQTSLRTYHLDDLASYVAALRERVEERLA